MLIWHPPHDIVEINLRVFFSQLCTVLGSYFYFSGAFEGVSFHGAQLQNN